MGEECITERNTHRFLLTMLFFVYIARLHGHDPQLRNNTGSNAFFAGFWTTANSHETGCSWKELMSVMYHDLEIFAVESQVIHAKQ